jgi:tetrahydromethanopterin S-methyltransferase subunit D
MKSGLFIITGLVLMAQTYWLLAWAIWGAPTSAWEYLALFGSVILIAAGITHIWKKTLGIYIAIAALLAIWCFYLPAIIVTTRTMLTSAAVPDPRWILTIGCVFAPLIASTILAIRDATDRLRRWR